MSHKEKRKSKEALMRQKLLDWYDQNGRDMPWRARSFPETNPYHVWLSEIMLQQTTVTTVKPYFTKFTTIWPTIKNLACATEDQVLTQWAGLGYYSRARNLLKTAKIIVDEYNGIFPKDIQELKTLPGIGDYTASAIRSIAYNKVATVVDGNVERVISRMYQVKTPLPQAKSQIKEKASQLVSEKRPAAYSQAIMDLGAMICTPRNPKCDICPWRDDCSAFGDQTQELYPIKKRKKQRPKKNAYAFVFVDKQGRIFLRKRPDHGLFAGMMEIPTTPWLKEKNFARPDFLDSHVNVTWLKGSVRHVFTHLDLNVNVAVLKKSCLERGFKGFWVFLADLDDYALPNLMLKIIQHAKQEIDLLTTQK